LKGISSHQTGNHSSLILASYAGDCFRIISSALKRSCPSWFSSAYPALTFQFIYDNFHPLVARSEAPFPRHSFNLYSPISSQITNGPSNTLGSPPPAQRAIKPSFSYGCRQILHLFLFSFPFRSFSEARNCCRSCCHPTRARTCPLLFPLFRTDTASLIQPTLNLFISSRIFCFLPTSFKPGYGVPRLVFPFKQCKWDYHSWYVLIRSRLLPVLFFLFFAISISLLSASYELTWTLTSFPFDHSCLRVRLAPGPSFLSGLYMSVVTFQTL